MQEITGTDAIPARAEHSDDCIEWCNHCALCGTPIAWGDRCIPHHGVYPEAD